MITIYCSQKLEDILSRTPGSGGTLGSAENDYEPLLGNWNGYTIRLSGKQCLLFVNSKTCYCVVITCIQNDELENIWFYFKERLISVLNEDFELPEFVEVAIRRELAQLRLCRTNHDTQIDGTIKEVTGMLRHYSTDLGFVEPEEEITMSIFLNYRPVTAKVWALGENAEEFSPIDAMQNLIDVFEDRLKADN